MKFLKWAGEHPVLTVVLVVVISDAVVGIIRAIVN